MIMNDGQYNHRITQLNVCIENPFNTRSHTRDHIFVYKFISPFTAQGLSLYDYDRFVIQVSFLKPVCSIGGGLLYMFFLATSQPGMSQVSTVSIVSIVVSTTSIAIIMMTAILKWTTMLTDISCRCFVVVLVKANDDDD